MSTEKSGWDKIDEQENKSVHRNNTRKKFDNAAETVSYVSWIVFVVAVAVIGIVAFTILSK